MAERTMKKWITADVALEEIIKKCGWNPHFEMDYKTVGAICVTVVDDKEMLLNFVPVLIFLNGHINRVMKKT